MVRTRFAPSPTGFMHVGGVRTALFAWAFARQQGGQFILRIEDTDKQRETVGSIDHIMESLRWLGIEWDEGPDANGQFGPYTQSDRLELYQRYAQQLIDADMAYADPFTPAEVDTFRQQAQAAKRPFLFRNHRPDQPTTPADWYGQMPIRFKVTQPKRYTWHDEVRGSLSAGEEALDDIIIMKADGYPTYNFAHIIDDQLMAITHVIRGEEFIASVPKYLSLYEALGWKPPVFATAPPILGKEGSKKLSKRDGAKDVLAYRDAGYLPDAVVNFLASLGWNDGTEQEVFSPPEIIDRFSLGRIQKSGARFDETKLDWLNWQHFARLTPRQQITKVTNAPPPQFDRDDYAVRVASLAASKAHNVAEFTQQVAIFAQPPQFQLSEQQLQQVDKLLTADRAKQLLSAAQASLTKLDTFTADQIEQTLRDTMASQNAQPREFLNLVRWAISGQKVSPNLFEMMDVLGQETVLARLKTVV